MASDYTAYNPRGAGVAYHWAKYGSSWYSDLLNQTMAPGYYYFDLNNRPVGPYATLETCDNELDRYRVRQGSYPLGPAFTQGTPAFTQGTPTPTTMKRSDLYEYVIVHQPTTDGTKASVLVPATLVLAKSSAEVRVVAARAVPEEYDEKLDEVEIVVRPFGGTMVC